MLPAGDPQNVFRVHYRSGMFEASTLCVTRQELERAGWRVIVPKTAWSCR